MMLIPFQATPSVLRHSIPNFSPSRAVCAPTASGVITRTGLFVWRTTFSAQVSCMGVLPIPQSPMLAHLPFSMVQDVSDC